MISGISAMQMELRYLLSVGSPEAKEIDGSERRAFTESLEEGFDVTKKYLLVLNVWFGTTEHHPDPQWLITAWDFKAQNTRDFAMVNIHEVKSDD